jgi:hypothetical protein
MELFLLVWQTASVTFWVGESAALYELVHQIREHAEALLLRFLPAGLIRPRREATRSPILSTRSLLVL